MSKYTRSLPLPIISLLNKNRELIYNPYFPNMAIVGHALCVSKAKRTALACAHSEAQLSKRKTVGFYKDPELSADDITYGLLAFHYLDKSQAAIEPFMDALADFIDTVPERELSASVNERVTVAEPVSKSASVNERVSVSEQRESAKKTSKTSTRKKTSKRKSKDKPSSESEREALAKVIARKHKSTSTQRNPKISLQRVNKEAHEADAYLRSIKDVKVRSAIMLDAINSNMMNDSEIQKRGATFDETAKKSEQIVVDHTVLDTYMALTTDKRTAFMQVIYQKHVKGQTQDETANTDSTTQDA